MAGFFFVPQGHVTVTNLSSTGPCQVYLTHYAFVMFALTFPHLCLILATIGALMVILLPGLVSWTAKPQGWGGRDRKGLTVGFRGQAASHWKGNGEAMTKRQRPGKRERETSVKAAIRTVRNAKMNATRKVMAELREEQHLARGYGKSSANRDKLKGGTGSVGFYGGRGYGSPKGPTGPLTEDKLGRMTPAEATPRNIGAVVPRPNGPTSSRFAEDTFPVEKPSLTVERRAGKRERFKVIGRVRVRLPDPTAKK